MKLALVLAMLTLLGACGGAAATPEASDHAPEGNTIDGTFALHAQGGNFAGACKGSGGYSDIAGGMNITLKDGEGTVLGTSRLATGQASDDRKMCLFEFGFDDVPDVNFYVLDAGRRGQQTYSREELEANDWTIGLEIGG